MSRSKHMWSVLKIFHTRMVPVLRVNLVLVQDGVPHTVLNQDYVSIMKLDITKTVCVHSVELFSIYNLHTYITSCCYCNPFKMSIK